MMKITNILKEKSKEICNLSAYIIAASLITSPLAFAAPFQENQEVVHMKFRTTADSADGCSYNIDRHTMCFSVSAYDDYLTGETKGTINITIFNYSSGGYGNNSYLSCYGSEYARNISVNPSGSVSIKATFNPSDHLCFLDNWNAEDTVTINLSGRYTDGGYRASNTNKGTVYYNGTTYRSNGNSDSFEETFTGSIVGYNGPWKGTASRMRVNDRQEVK